MSLGDYWYRFRQWVESQSRIGYTLYGVVVAVLVSVIVQLLVFDDLRLGTVVGVALGIGIVNYTMGQPSSQ